MNRQSDYPYWAFRTFRQFQRKKRADLRALRKALERMRTGVAYVPGHRHFEEMDASCKALESVIRPGNWK